MFKQFIDKVSGGEWYLITSLWIFLVFFIIVGIMLIRSNKNHIAYMSRLPLTDEKND
ncbi:hypothetical protein [Pedobacter sp. BS3]|uniref:hypothetical protein n=1 Tax=Pedobacter sp. BS3 TaxID=2567937 RepID=UPI001659C751|nr:hypothetical protein [Pedobacter sp. BS3]